MNQAEHKADDLERKLALPEVLDLLMADGLVSAEDGAQLKHERRYFRGDTHPLLILAEQKWKSAKPPHRLLTLDELTEWLAGRSGLPYYHIDPLKIDFSAVTDVMSNAYATRFRILPVQVTARDVVVATAEPFVREWEKELRPILRKEIRRVIANPQIIERYLVEFYNLAKSVKRAMKRARPVPASRTSSNWSNWAAPTASSTPTTSISSISSTGCGSTRSSSGPAISTSSRGANSASCVSASTACCIRSTRFRCR